MPDGPRAASAFRVPPWWNVPNQITTARLILAIVVFGCMDLRWYTAALIVFLLAASTDWVDGYWARRYGQVTKLGRILDPFVDKFIICGVFIYLAAVPDSGVPPWVAVLVTARELLVTALRGMVEGQGGDFSAKWSGKWKMVFQCAAAALSLLILASRGTTAPTWTFRLLIVALGLAVSLTIHSGFVYVLAAARSLRAAP
ncbi:MAG: CDP-diacylglycerol--glycerol-3-phosphate 3-phosphatidyltransferase [Planctomycetes bacterium]|nr:CDP-diacylglycerol--glycerol-3-phosphate 3-phosphatidyltransferase [Planctomycetota bacterium]